MEERAQDPLRVADDFTGHEDFVMRVLVLLPAARREMALVQGHPFGQGGGAGGHHDGHRWEFRVAAPDGAPDALQRHGDGTGDLAGGGAFGGGHGSLLGCWGGGGSAPLTPQTMPRTCQPVQVTRTTSRSVTAGSWISSLCVIRRRGVGPPSWRRPPGPSAGPGVRPPCRTGPRSCAGSPGPRHLPPNSRYRRRPVPYSSGRSSPRS